MIRGAVLALLLAGACGRPQYLGAAMPAPCTAKDMDGCLGWMVERDLTVAELGGYDDAALRAYVQRVVDRLARGSSLGRAPRVLLADREGTYATVGGRIVVARPTLEKLGSEAELAGILAHEMAHLEGKHTVASLFGPHPDDDWLVMRRDAEAIADERAVYLLARAGYAPMAMARALERVLTVEDEEHPAKEERIARARTLARGGTGFEGKDELLAQITGMVVGRDPRAGVRIGDAWVIASLGVAFDLHEDDLVRAADDLLVIRRGPVTLTGYVLGAPWANELGKALVDREVRETDLGPLTTGTIRLRTTTDDSPLGKLQRAIRATLPQPAPGARVAILPRAHGALVFEIGGRRSSRLGLRAATEDEIEATQPARIEIVHATKRGAIAALDPCRVLLDDPDRIVAIGDPIKCADRRPLERPTEASDRAAAETPRDE